MTEEEIAEGYHFSGTVYQRTVTPALVLQLIAIAEAHTAECQACEGLGDQINLRRDGADVSECSTCHGTGQQCVGFSGSPDDGNGPVMEPCGECGYGSDLPEEVLFTEAWKRRFQYSPSYQFFDTRSGWLTPKDDPVHMGWVGWQLARAAGLPPVANPQHYYNEGHKSGYEQANGDKDDIIAAVNDDLLDKIIKRHGWFREEVRHQEAMVFRMNLLTTIRDALQTVNELTVDDIAG